MKRQVWYLVCDPVLQPKEHSPWFLGRIVTIDRYLLSARHCRKHFDRKVKFNQHHLQFIDETAESQGVVQFVNSYTANKWHHQDLNPGLFESRACAF